MSWLFSLPSNSISGGITGENKNPQGENLYQTIRRTVFSSSSSPKTTTTTTKTENNSSTQTSSSPSTFSPIVSKASSSGLIPVESTHHDVPKNSIFRCGGNLFGVQSMKSSSENHTKEKITFHVSCGNEDSAEHGVMVGLSPKGCRVDTAMMFDEPGSLFLNCTSKGGTLWSESLNLYGNKISDKCLERTRNDFLGRQKQEEEGETSSSRYEGVIGLSFDKSDRTVEFTVLSQNNNNNQKDDEEGQLLGGKKSVKSVSTSSSSSLLQYPKEAIIDPNTKEKIEFLDLLPTVCFTTVVGDDAVTIV